MHLDDNKETEYQNTTVVEERLRNELTPLFGILGSLHNAQKWQIMCFLDA